MESEISTIPLIRTKLQRPPIVGVHVHRSQLLKRLDQRRQRPLTLVTAPAGYGKSTLVSCWLDACNVPSAWLSLDETDNDLHSFLSYLLAAVQTVSPAAGTKIQSMLNSAELPHPSVLTGILINELDQIEQAFILTLDDYHVIQKTAIHDLLIAIIKHPPRAMHLVLASRIDPPLPLASMRARGEMTEIRVQDLRFTLEETAEFLKKMMGDKFEDRLVGLLGKKTEGWVTGLRLAALSLRHHQDLNRILTDLPNDNRYVMDYLIAEVLSHQKPHIQDYLLSTSILNRFCAPLCEAVCLPSSSSGQCELNGREFIDWAEYANLFVILLDDERKWFRYHHLFQGLLKRQLRRRFSPENIDNIHKRAGIWFADNGFIEEAVEHFLDAGDASSAIGLVSGQRHEIMNSEQWHRLQRWIRMLPPEGIENNPNIIILRAWMCENWVRLEEMRSYLKKARSLIEEAPSKDTAQWKSLKAEMHALEAFLHYIDGDGKRAADSSLLALEGLEPRAKRARCWAQCILALGYQMTGELKKAYTVIRDALKEEAPHATKYHSMLYIALSFVHWIAADLTGLKQSASQGLKLGKNAHLPETISIASYHLGTFHYFRNELKKADNILNVVVKKHYEPSMLNFAHSAFTLTLCYQAQGHPQEARKMVGEVISKAMEINSTEMLGLAEAFQAELALRQGNIAKAQKWADRFDPHPFHPGYRFYVPQFTLAKVYLAQNNPKSLKKASDLLSKLYEYYSAIYNTHCLIDVLSLQALLNKARGDEPSAFAKLTESLTLAEPGGYLRPFLDLGPEMAGLFGQLAKQGVHLKFVGMLLRGFRNEMVVGSKSNINVHAPIKQAAPNPGPLESLSKREFEVMKLLGERLSNKEIAEIIFVSSDTVKKHLYNIYQKLNVKNRREAIRKAKALDIL